MSGRIAPRRIGIHGRQTSIRLEMPFWLWLRQIAAECGCSAKLLIECIYASKSPSHNLSSAIRIYVAAYCYGSVPNHALVDPTSRFALARAAAGRKIGRSNVRTHLSPTNRCSWETD
jgi:predicted DNA-binding ribbon-helix-helix protein